MATGEVVDKIEFTLNVKPLSVNECWQGRRYKTPAYKAYERKCFFLLPKYVIHAAPLKISLTWGVSNMQSDVDNPAKPFLDILQKRFKFNDAQIDELILSKKKVKKGEEFIKAKIEYT